MGPWLGQLPVWALCIFIYGSEGSIWPLRPILKQCSKRETGITHSMQSLDQLDHLSIWLHPAITYRLGHCMYWLSY